MTRRRVITATTRSDGSTVVTSRRSIGPAAGFASLVAAIVIVLWINNTPHESQPWPVQDSGSITSQFDGQVQLIP
jgi:hypothetical protein